MKRMKMFKIIKLKDPIVIMNNANIHIKINIIFHNTLLVILQIDLHVVNAMLHSNRKLNLGLQLSNSIIN